MKVRRSTLITALLAVYMIVMATLGYKDYASGATGALEYFGLIAICCLILVMLFFSLRHRERLRRERLDDMNRNNQ